MKGREWNKQQWRRDPLHEALGPGTDKYSGFYTVTCIPKHSARVLGSLESHTKEASGEVMASLCLRRQVESSSRGMPELAVGW